MKSISLAYDGDYDWAQMANWLGMRAIPAVETVADGRYARSIALAGGVGTIELSVSDGPELTARVRFPDASALPAIVDRIKRIFDLDADLTTINAHLATDPHLAPLIARRPALRVPGAWDGYELAVRAVLGQQISVGAASKLAGKLVERFGSALPQESQVPESSVRLTFPRPEVLADADIASLGMPAARAATIRNVARAAAVDPRLFEPAHDLDGSIERLRRLPGIGEWTAQYIAMRALREPDAFPAADIGLLRALADEEGGRPTPRRLLELAQRWRPWRAYAAVHLWAADAERREKLRL